MTTNSPNSIVATEQNKLADKKIAKKIFCIGTRGCGKTSFINSWINNDFNPECESTTGTQVSNIIPQYNNYIFIMFLPLFFIFTDCDTTVQC